MGEFFVIGLKSLGLDEVAVIGNRHHVLVPKDQLEPGFAEEIEFDREQDEDIPAEFAFDAREPLTRR